LLRSQGGLLTANLEQASSFEEVQTRLEARSYDLVLFQYDSSEDEALRIVQTLRSKGKTIPFLFLTEEADEATLAEIGQAGACQAFPPRICRTSLNRFTAQKRTGRVQDSGWRRYTAS